MVLPAAAGAEELVDLVAPFVMGEQRAVFLRYGNPAHFTVFDSMVSGLAALQGPWDLTDNIVRQIWANLTGLEENAVSDEEVWEVKGALGLLGSQV